MVNNQLTKVIVGIILDTIREEKGRLTEISDQSVINRQEFDEEKLANMKFYRVVRLGRTMAKSLPRKRYDQMKSEISDKFWESIENEEFEHAKAGKTSLTAMLMACCVSKEVLLLKRNTEQPLKVLWFDTEQSLATTKRILKEKVGRLIEGDFPEESFYVFNTRQRTPQERCDRLALAIETYRPDIAIVDGVADLTDDINSGTESTKLMQQLLSMAQEYKCNITANIHLNRTGDKFNLRGWLGTLMLQKSYEVFNCEKMADGETLAVSILFSRLRSTHAEHPSLHTLPPPL